MVQKIENDSEIIQGRFASVRVSLLIVIIGFIIMILAIYHANKIISFYFNIALLIIVIGTCLFAMAIISKIYSIPQVPLPEPLRDFIDHGFLKSTPSSQSESSGAAGYAAPAPITSPSRGVVGTTPVYPPSTTASPATASPAIPTPPAPMPSPPTQPSVPPAGAPSPKFAPTSPATPPVQPVPSKERYMDVLEETEKEAEADKEFEKYIDQLIEE